MRKGGTRGDGGGSAGQSSGQSSGGAEQTRNESPDSDEALDRGKAGYSVGSVRKRAKRKVENQFIINWSVTRRRRRRRKGGEGVEVEKGFPITAPSPPFTTLNHPINQSSTRANTSTAPLTLSSGFTTQTGEAKGCLRRLPLTTTPQSASPQRPRLQTPHKPPTQDFK